MNTDCPGNKYECPCAYHVWWREGDEAANRQVLIAMRNRRASLPEQRTEPETGMSKVTRVLAWAGKRNWYAFVLNGWLVRRGIISFEQRTEPQQVSECADCGVPVGGVHSLLCVRRSQHGEHIVRSGNIREVSAAQQTRSEQ